MNKLNTPAAPTPMYGDRAMISQAEFSKFQQTLTSFSTKLSSLTIDVKTDSAKMNEREMPNLRLSESRKSLLFMPSVSILPLTYHSRRSADSQR